MCTVCLFIEGLNRSKGRAISVKYPKLNKNRAGSLPTLWKSLSVLTNAATSARGSTASHSSLLKHVGMARKTLCSRFSFAYMAAPDPLCPSNSYQQNTVINNQLNIKKTVINDQKAKNTVITDVPSDSYHQNTAKANDLPTEVHYPSAPH
jgi:hypothetical protein